MRPALAIALVAIAIAGCGGGSDEQPVPKPTDREVIRGWIAALNASDYVAAASYFAKDAIVEQTDELRLHTRDEAEGFNQSLPCRADLTDTEDEGKATLATFRLRAGPGGPCHGSVRVRFTIKNGKFTEWRQLPQHEPGSSV